MAEFDPYEPAENETNQQPKEQDSSGHGQSRPEDYGQCGCDSGFTGSGAFDFERRQGCDSDAGRSDSFVADWSGAEKSLSEQAASFEAREMEMAQGQPQPPQKFWGELVASQAAQPPAESSEPGRPQQSDQFWGDLVRSQSPAGEAAPLSTDYSLSKPVGMGWADEEASEWAPPQRETELVSAAAEPVESENATARRDDVEWSAPASAQDAWESVRSEALDVDSKPQSLMAAAVEVAQAKEKQKKARARKPAAKKQVKAKTTAAKKPAKKAAAKKKVVKKAAKKTPMPKIESDPTRRAA